MESLLFFYIIENSTFAESLLCHMSRNRLVCNKCTYNSKTCFKLQLLLYVNCITSTKLMHIRLKLSVCLRMRLSTYFNSRIVGQVLKKFTVDLFQ